MAQKAGKARKVIRFAKKVVPDVGKVIKESDSPGEAVDEAKRQARKGTQEFAKDQFKESLQDKASGMKESLQEQVEKNAENVQEKSKAAEEKMQEGLKHAREKLKGVKEKGEEIQEGISGSSSRKVKNIDDIKSVNGIKGVTDIKTPKDIKGISSIPSYDD